MSNNQNTSRNVRSSFRIIYIIRLLSDLNNLIRQISRSKTAEIAGDVIGALCLFAMLFIGLFFVGVFQ